MTDAFGLVALVAMTPLVAIQLLGLAGRVRKRLADDALKEVSAREMAYPGIRNQRIDIPVSTRSMAMPTDTACASGWLMTR